MNLSAQTIKAFCTNQVVYVPYLRAQPYRQMITPFQEESIRINGVSGGLSAASYDIHIKHDLVLGRHPGIIMRDIIIPSTDAEDFYQTLRNHLGREEPHIAVVEAVESLDMPDCVSAVVHDKSTYARLQVSAFNTFADPGFKGDFMIELVNHGEHRLELRAGQPVAQLVFTFLDRRTDRPYKGQYQGQKGLTPARFGTN